MNSSRRQFLETGAKFCAAAIAWTSTATEAEVYVPFQGEKRCITGAESRNDANAEDST